MLVSERFLTYISYDTQSQAGSGDIPSTSKQKKLAKHLARELRDMGAEVKYDSDHCYVYAHIASNSDKELPCIGFIAHMDTSPAVSGKGVRAQMFREYDGGDLPLGGEGLTLSPGEYPSLKRYIGDTIITTDGTTLLGADDKAGVAEIMALAEHLTSNPDIKHGKIAIAFTPDEEVGHGVSFFNLEAFGADFAYTVDGEYLGTINYENFNAANVTVNIKGVSAHPGDAKGKMKNACTMAMEFHSLLPAGQRPEDTEGYEGFFHLDNIAATVDSAEMSYIIRDHDSEKFEAKKKLFLDAIGEMGRRYGAGSFSAEIYDAYRNMSEVIKKNMHLVDNAAEAMRRSGVKPEIITIRGGTDGCMLSYMGLPCPNLCTGGENFHSRFEYIPVQSMEKVVDILVEIVKLYSE